MLMSEEEIIEEVTDLRERGVRLEVKLEELTKRIDSLASYAKELYNYLHKQTSR